MATCRTSRRIAGTLLLSAFLVGPSGPANAKSICAPSPFQQIKPLVIAHASGTYFGPGNTVEMMRAAVKAGADVIDVDVRLTADGVLVAAHDDAISSDSIGGSSGKRAVSESTYADLLQVDLGDSWAGPKRNFPLRGKKVRIPTVEQVLTAFPNRLTSLEFKVTGGEASMCTLLRRLNRTRTVYVGSAGDAPVDTFKPLCPEVVTTVTDAMVIDMQAARNDPNSTWCAPVPIGQPPYRVARSTEEFVRWNHEHGLAVFTWTIDDTATLKTLANVGVDAVYTNRADLARKAFDRKTAKR